MSPMRDQIDQLVESVEKIRAAVETVIWGKTSTVNISIMTLLAEGHLLLEDVPGVGKTMLAKALGSAIDLSIKRIQFTPDLLPSDITGVSVYNQQTSTFEFSPGGIFANIVLGDEINRASPKTQAALLEAMEEMQVSVDGKTHQLPFPFMVIATQNPIDMEGTYPLPEAQRDRFMMKIEMGYPIHEAEVAMLNAHGGEDPLDALKPVADQRAIAQMIQTVRQVYVAPVLKHYLVDVVNMTRQAKELRMGASPRSALQLLRAARAKAAMEGREYVNPDDIRDLAPKVLSHRVIASAQAQLGSRTINETVTALVNSVPVPGENR